MKHDWSVLFPAATQSTIGHDVRHHSELDQAQFWTFIDQEPFLSSGIVDTVELFAGEGGRSLNVGIFQPQSGKECDYKLVQQVSLQNIKKGVNKVRRSMMKISMCSAFMKSNVLLMVRTCVIFVTNFPFTYFGLH